jgi:hypothetical protein
MQIYRLNPEISQRNNKSIPENRLWEMVRKNPAPNLEAANPQIETNVVQFRKRGEK